MNCEYLILVIILLIFLIPYIREEYQQDYKVYKQSSDSLIPKHQYRMGAYPFEWAYRTDYFPLEKTSLYEREEAPMGACFNHLWSCSI
jgi:hypothetical protein